MIQQNFIVPRKIKKVLIIKQHQVSWFFRIISSPLKFFNEHFDIYLVVKNFLLINKILIWIKNFFKREKKFNHQRMVAEGKKK